jgi:hypothetical protein
MPKKTYRLKNEYEDARDVVLGDLVVSPIPYTTADDAEQRQLDQHPAFTDKPAPKGSTPSADKKENS